MQDILYMILGEVRDTRAIMERLERRMTSMEERMMSMEAELAAWRPYRLMLEA